MSELNLILIGPPGAGKGTQAEQLQNDFRLPYIATGDLMRAKRREDSELGREIDRIISEGELVPDDIVSRALFEEIDARGDDGFLLDGFPRTKGQADTLDAALEQRGRGLTAVLHIDVPDDVIVQRDDDRPEVIQKRLDVYHRETKPLLQRYEDAGILRSFDGTRTPDEVHRHIRATLATLRLEERL